MAKGSYSEGYLLIPIPQRLHLILAPRRESPVQKIFLFIVFTSLGFKKKKEIILRKGV